MCIYHPSLKKSSKNDSDGPEEAETKESCNTEKEETGEHSENSSNKEHDWLAKVKERSMFLHNDFVILFSALNTGACRSNAI